MDRDSVLPPFVEMVGHVLDKASIRDEEDSRILEFILYILKSLQGLNLNSRIRLNQNRVIIC